MKYGLARALRDGLPNATFLAFTGTPISQDDRDTQAVLPLKGKILTVASATNEKTLQNQEIYN